VTLTFQFCSSEGYESTFKELKDKIGFMHPEVFVNNEECVLPPTKKMLSQAVSVLQLGVMGIGIGGNFIPAIRDHALYQRFQANKMVILVGGYFGLNMLKNAVSSTGAFEVFLNGELIFSKLVKNRLPVL
jgi:selT/selW/selH-like putative selenoprotein